VTTVIVLGAPRSGTTFLLHALRGLRSTVTKSGTLVPAVIPHLAGHGTELGSKTSLSDTLGRAFDAYLSSDYNSRFQALEYWRWAPLQVERLVHVFRRWKPPSAKALRVQGALLCPCSGDGRGGAATSIFKAGGSRSERCTFSTNNSCVNQKRLGRKFLITWRRGAHVHFLARCLGLEPVRSASIRSVHQKRWRQPRP